MTPSGARTYTPPSSYPALWSLNTRTDLSVYIGESITFDQDDPDANKLVWSETGIALGDQADVREKELVIPCSENVQNNGSLYAHIFLTKEGASHDPLSDTFNRDSTFYLRTSLIRHMRKKKEVKKKALIGGARATEDPHLPFRCLQLEDLEEPEPEPSVVPIVSYWWPNLTINTVASDSPVSAQLPPVFMKHISLTTDGLHHYPITFTNDFWMFNDDLMLVNETVKTLNLTLSYASIPYWKFQLFKQFEESFKLQTEMLGSPDQEMEQIKRMFRDTSPFLLVVTMAVSILHSLFDFLAFKNDISHWKNKKHMEGLSFRTIILNVFFQAVILLYLLDNDTSWMILFSNGAGLLIEIWKIQKTVIIKPKATFPFVEFIDRVKPSKLVSKTRKYDEIAFKYLSYIIYPCLVGYTIYSMVYEEHKGWYSFIVGTLVGFVYTFGFISMTPQLFINYKLKSVAHMPWKTFMYKALNTFVDDLFAFVIKMPILHRIACLRDDVVFFVYLYQRWTYKEDKRRRNEFGQVGEEGADDDEEDSDVEGEKAVEGDTKAVEGRKKEDKTPARAAATGAKEAKKTK
ncbi:cleft lip and palate transmembrane protein 1-domain-containing protein [Blyttiomyces helicus]|uniref:Cleft lip and palate transmembrane protein 1-domain-containing protein n=1 Tax=Blyttiomyces helicus TaxID=388810 RepID=A0A4P9WKG1_9FUNG|nr:cleft lip and palate transmembrane protein 1-domain-containing protein [Blyttiomyces helicus]|eukprot:RKO92493.1 cleft lip and palate transmembrane protein 1-domain-containing protein [Blyttiomyces helicus]